MRSIVGLFEHTPIEREPRQLAVDEPIGRVGLDRGQVGGLGEGHVTAPTNFYAADFAPCPARGRCPALAGMIS